MIRVILPHPDREATLALPAPRPPYDVRVCPVEHAATIRAQGPGGIYVAALREAADGSWRGRLLMDGYTWRVRIVRTPQRRGEEEWALEVEE